MANNKILDKFKYLIGLDDLEDDLEEEFEESEIQERLNNKTNNKNRRVLNIHTNSNIRLVVFQPSKYEDTTKIVEALKNRKPVVVNLLNLDDELKRKVFDFVNGALYALEGDIQKVAKDIFILAPNNVEIDSNMKEALKNNGIFNWKK